MTAQFCSSPLWFPPYIALIVPLTPSTSPLACRTHGILAAVLWLMLLSPPSSFQKLASVPLFSLQPHLRIRSGSFLKTMRNDGGTVKAERERLTFPQPRQESCVLAYSLDYRCFQVSVVRDASLPPFLFLPSLSAASSTNVCNSLEKKTKRNEKC